MTSIGLYVHVPFCLTKCGYCDFCSHVPQPGQPTRLVDALLRELRGSPAGESPSVRVRTAFIGGGTPTTLPFQDATRLLRDIGAIVRRDGATEFTVEANPATLDSGLAELLFESGVNRLSVGVQSFVPAELACLGRKHTPRAVTETLATARACGLSRFNLDLIYGIPGQTLSSWRESIRQAVACDPEHISCYALSYEPGTPLEQARLLGRIVPCDESAEAAMYDLATDHLAEAGFEHYEISNFAKPSARCEHNLGYWRNEPYLGIGPSACSYIDGRRSRTTPDTEDYIQRVAAGRTAVDESEQLNARESAGETAMLALRLIEGLDICWFQTRTGFNPLHLFAQPIRQHLPAGRILVTPSHIRLSRAGLLIADTIIADFLAAASSRGLTDERTSG